MPDFFSRLLPLLGPVAMRVKATRVVPRFVASYEQAECVEITHTHTVAFGPVDESHDARG